MNFLIGKKLEMTQVWQGDDVVAVTKIQTGTCPIVQVKTKAKDGYESIQVGFGEKKDKNTKAPQKGHLKKLKESLPALKTGVRYLREFRVSNGDFKVGDIIDINSFAAGDTVDVIGTSKGLGFQGVVKRHGFHGHNKTHGTKDSVRMPGSIGACGPAHVLKGTRMGGRMGGDRMTQKNLKIVSIDEENNIILVRGAVPGARNGLLIIQGQGDIKLKVAPKVEEKVEAEVKAEVAVEAEVKAEVVVEAPKAETAEVKEVKTE